MFCVPRLDAEYGTGDSGENAMEGYVGLCGVSWSSYFKLEVRGAMCFTYSDNLLWLIVVDRWGLWHFLLLYRASVSRFAYRVGELS